MSGRRYEKRGASDPTSGPDALRQAGRAPQRFATGVPNLDRVLGGGLLRGATVMVIGPPGSGKTILGQQIAFAAASRGEAALYFLGYSESYDKLLAHNQSLTYFAEELIGEQIHFGSLPDLLEQGPAVAEEAVVETARTRSAALVVLDGFSSMRGFMPDDHTAAQFVYSLGAKLALLGATLLVLVEGDATERHGHPEQSVSDVIVSLSRVVRAGAHRRQVEVLKVRGAAPLPGVHPFVIDAAGVCIYPRLESLVPADMPPWPRARVGFGVAEIDRLLGGGVNVGTATLAAGTPGLGKTLLGLHLLAEGARQHEPGLFAGFTETAEQVRAKASTFGLGLEAAEAAGTIRLLHVPPHDLDADCVAWMIREDVEARGVRRLVIDSATELEAGLTPPERAPMFMASLVAYLRSRGVTTYITVDVPTIVGSELSFAGTPLVVFAENLLFQRYTEYDGELHRLFSVLKMRFSDFDRALHVYTIEADRGIRILGRAPRAAGLLTGLARPLDALDTTRGIATASAAPED